jgi:hypothetical protein
MAMGSGPIQIFQIQQLSGFLLMILSVVGQSIQDHRLMDYLDKSSTTVKNQFQLKKIICAYIYIKLRRNDDFSDEGKIKKTFFKKNLR